jgi:uncharacterized protein (DUF2336 family)
MTAQNRFMPSTRNTLPSTRNTLVVANAGPPVVHHRHIVRRFLAWAQHAAPATRAEAASALARAYLCSDLSPPLRAEVALAVTSMMDDCVEVRRAVAEAFAGARNAPRHLVVALANDVPEVAAPVLARSPLMTDAELVDCAAIGGLVSQCAIARRPFLPVGPAAALAEVGRRDAALALIANSTASLTPKTLRRLLARFGGDPEIREALLARPGLPSSLRALIALETTDILKTLAESTRWLESGRAERVAREARDATLVTIAADCPPQERAELARTLREHGALTIAVLLRSLLSGERDLLSAALAEISGLAYTRASAFVRDPRGQGFAALARKSGLPRHAISAFRAALEAIEVQGAGEPGGLKLGLVEATIRACEVARDPAQGPILALLWRFAAEAALVEARATARAAANEPDLPQELAFAPANDDSGAAEIDWEPIKALPAPTISADDPAEPSQRQLPPLRTFANAIRSRDAA